MAKRRGGFVEKFFYTIIAYTHGNISLKIFLFQCADIPWNLILSIRREYTADPVHATLKNARKSKSQEILMKRISCCIFQYLMFSIM